MARPLRLEYPGAIYHVTARGNERRAIFRGDGDRERFLLKLGELVVLHHVDVYAFALMGNHYHLAVCTPRAGLCAFMQQFQTSYTVWFNRRHGRSGHLFEGRYKAKVVEGGHYLLNLTRYIHLNPVKVGRMRDTPRAAKADYLRAYPWSSFASYAGYATPIGWMCYDTLEAFPDVASDSQRRAEYVRFVEEALEEDDQWFLQALAVSSKAVGDEAFCRWVESRFLEATAGRERYIDISMRRRESPAPVPVVTSAVLDAYGIRRSELFRRGNREAKDFWMRLACDLCGMTQRDVGSRLGHADGAVVSRRMRLLDEAMAEAPELQRRYGAIRAATANVKA